jgi:MFS family permease
VLRAGWAVLTAPLGNRDYLLFWLGNLASLTGDQFQIVALTLLVLDLPQGAVGLGAVLTVQAVPRVVLTVLSGVVIDRLRPRSVLLASHVCQAVAVAGLVLLAVTGWVELWHLYVYALVSGTALAFSYPAASTLIPELLPPSQVRSANSLAVSMLNLTRFLVPPVASWLVAWAGVALAFGVNALSFLVAALCVGLIRSALPSRGGREGAPVPWTGQLVSGLRAARDDGVIWLAVVVSTIYSLGYYGTAFVSLPAFATIDLQGGEKGVGIIYSALGAGALLGAVLAGATRRLPRSGLIGSAVTGLNGAALAGAGLSSSIWTTAGALVVSGGCGAVSAVIFFSLVQTRAGEGVRGRILALYSTAIVGMFPLSFGLAGLVNGLLGSRWTVVSGGLVVLLAGVVGLAGRPMRRAELPEA